MAIIKSRIFSYKFKSVIIPTVATIQSYITTNVFNSTTEMSTTEMSTNTTVYEPVDFYYNNVTNDACLLHANIVLCILMLIIYCLFWY